MPHIAPAKKPRGRPSSFNREELIERIMHLFWEHGYNNISFNEIAKGTGLTRASLYNSFESKEALLIEAMEHYAKQAPDHRLDKIQDGDSITSAFYALFEEAASARASDEKLRGCFAINCINELVSHNKTVGPKVLAMYKHRRDGIKVLLEQAIRQEELTAGTDTDTTANLIIAFMSGFSTFSKSGASQQELLRMSYGFLTQIGFSSPSGKVSLPN